MQPGEGRGKTRRAYTLSHLDEILRKNGVDPELALKIKATAYIFPFKANEYIVDELIDWSNVPEDPVFRLIFPLPDMLQEADSLRIAEAIRNQASTAEIAEIIYSMRLKYLPTDTEEGNPGVPTKEGRAMRGFMKLTPGTLVLFPKPSSECFSYCGYCYRWTQATLRSVEFNYSDPNEPIEYLRNNPDISNVVFSGGDPLTMRTDLIKKFIDPILSIRSVRTICFNTKALGWWPYRFTSEDDSAALLHYFGQIRQMGKHLSLSAHFSHPRELTTGAVKCAVEALKKADVIIRCQGPLLRSINDSPETLAELWQRQVDLGLVPYYLFIESDSESRQYYKIPFAEVLAIFNEAQRKVSSLSKTVQGPVILNKSGKILLVGICRIAGSRLFIFKNVEHPDRSRVGELFFAEFDPCLDHVNQLKRLSVDACTLLPEEEVVKS